MPKILRQADVISRCGNLFRADKLKDNELCEGLCSWHLSYVIPIAHHPGISAEELGRHVFVNKSNIARNLAHLEENGFITREQSKTDRRILCCYPTDKLNAVLPAVMQATNEWNDYITEDLTPDERATFESLLAKVAGRAREYYEGRDKQ